MERTETGEANVTTHYFRTIQGWFNFPGFYQWVANTLPNNGYKYVEVGSWKGQSLAFLLVELEARGKTGLVYAIDTWAGSVEHQKGGDAYDPLTENPHALMRVFCNNIQRHSNVVAQMGESVVISNCHTDETLDGVFIDASHEYADVYADCEAWWPKVKQGGFLSGHDMNWPDVRQAVVHFAKGREIFTDDVCWMIKKPIL